MTFLPYDKIPESADAWRLDPAGWRQLKKSRWIVTEKIHGANFCFVAEGGDIRCASRKGLLTEDDSFFAYRRMLTAQGEAARAVGTGLTDRPGVVRAFLYGELFGGGYPHPDVPQVEGVQPVQTGIAYCPDIRFSAFDLRIETADGEERYLDFEETAALCDAVGLLRAQSLRTDTYEKATAYPLGFDSTIPALLGLPPLPAGSNKAEGVVIKPLREILVVGASGPLRPVVKQKLPEFAEDRRFHEAEKWTEEPARYDGTQDLLQWEAYNRITTNRWDASVSKVGRDRLGEALDLLVEEVFTESVAAVGKPVTESDRQALLVYIRETTLVLTEGV